MKRALLVIVLVVNPCFQACTIQSVYEPTTDREGIQRIIGSHHAELEACFQRAIEERPGAEGKLVMMWDIAPDGSVAKVAVKSAGPKITAAIPCVSEEIRAWRFPKLSADEAEVSVTYPFYFSENGRVEGN